MDQLDYRALVRCLIDHTAGEHELSFKVAALQKSYDRRQTRLNNDLPTAAEEIERRIA